MVTARELMNVDALTVFWVAMPSVMKLLLAVFAGATVHFLRNRAVPVAEGLAGAAISVIAGFFLTFGLCYWRNWKVEDLWFVGSGVAFMANYFIGGMETVGKQIQETPIKMLIEAVADAYDVIKTRFKPKE